MAKNQAEWSNKFSVVFLKKHGYLEGGLRYGNIKWTYEMSGNESSIGFFVTIGMKDVSDIDDSIRLRYANTNRRTGEQENMDYRVELTTTPCNFGGKRYWFICPITKNGKYCGRRVGVLFSIGKWFGCRHCGEIAYATQMEGGKYRWNGVSIPDIERAEKEVKRYYYNGRPTRKYRRVMRLNEKFERSFIMMAAKLDKGFGSRFVGLKK